VIGLGFNEVWQSGPGVKILDPDPDPGSLNDNNKKIEKSEIKCFEVLNVFSEGPMASTLA
jgi:hypothetical protein